MILIAMELYLNYLSQVIMIENGFHLLHCVESVSDTLYLSAYFTSSLLQPGTPWSTSQS